MQMASKLKKCIVIACLFLFIDGISLFSTDLGNKDNSSLITETTVIERDYDITNNEETVGVKTELTEEIISTSELVTVVNNNKPCFDKLGTESFEIYSELDELGRCGVAFANIGPETMPTQERGEIGHIKPAGWHTVKYDCVEGNYLYNRCHLIAFCLAGENDNKKNLITGTRYFNTKGMLPYELMVAEYVENTGNHVYYRVTPIYANTESDLVASGVQIEAFSVEDNGAGICFNVYVRNMQPGICISYATGESYQY